MTESIIKPGVNFPKNPMPLAEDWLGRPEPVAPPAPSKLIGMLEEEELMQG
jgi:hypothetical protein